MSAKILITDDELQIRTLLAAILRDYEVIQASTGEEALELCRSERPDLVLSDINMPKMDGLAFLRKIKQIDPVLPVILVSANTDRDTLLDAMHSQAFDFVPKPFGKDQILSAVARALDERTFYKERDRLNDRVRSMRDEMEKHTRELAQLYENHQSDDSALEVELSAAFSHIVTRNYKMIASLQYIETVGPTNLPVLVTGETGVGKDLIARSVHNASGREGDYVAANVAGLDDNLFSDTLFGHVKGAFSSADQNRPGLIESAANGTLFLDEIGDLAPQSQVKLLRLLESGEYYPLGSDQVKKTNARFVVATHQPMQKLIESGQFREDLYYRLEAHQVRIPPLRERLDDVPLLIQHFLAAAAKATNKAVPKYPKELVTLLQSYHFPGNVRELRGLLYDAVSRHDKGMLSLEPIKAKMRVGQEAQREEVVDFDPEKLRTLPSLKDAEEKLIAEALRRTGGNQSQAALLLGMTRQALNKRLVRKDKKAS